MSSSAQYSDHVEFSIVQWQGVPTEAGWLAYASVLFEADVVGDVTAVEALLGCVVEKALPRVY